MPAVGEDHLRITSYNVCYTKLLREREAGAQITGNQLGLDQSRVDFSLEAFDRDKFAEYEKIANKVIAENNPVNLYLVSRSEAEEKLSRLTVITSYSIHYTKLYDCSLSKSSSVITLSKPDWATNESIFINLMSPPYIYIKS